MADRTSRRQFVRLVGVGGSALLLGACAPGASSTPPAASAGAPAAPAGAASPAAPAAAGDFQQLLAAARDEAARGTFQVWALRPGKDETQRALFDAFQQQYDLKGLHYEWLTIHPAEGGPRIIAEARAGRSGPANGYGSVFNIQQLDEAGLLEATDWVGLFGDALPGIKDAAVDRVEFPDLVGKAVVQSDVVRTFVFNTEQIKYEQVPNSIEELTDPRWSRKFVMSAGGTPFELLASVWGEEPTVQMLKRLAANNPILKKQGSPPEEAVAAGEAPIGLGNLNGTEELKAKGAPVDWKPIGEYLPSLVVYYAVLKNAPQPNLARLFVAWLVTDGAPITEKNEFQARITDPRSDIGKLTKQRAPNAKPISPTNAEALTAYSNIIRRAPDILAGTAG